MAEHADELITLLGVVFGLLIMVLAWIGSRVHSRLDALTTTVDNRFEQLYGVLRTIEGDLREDIHDHGERLAKIEARCSVVHGQD